MLLWTSTPWLAASAAAADEQPGWRLQDVDGTPGTRACLHERGGAPLAFQAEAPMPARVSARDAVPPFVATPRDAGEPR